MESVFSDGMGGSTQGLLFDEIKKTFSEVIVLPGKLARFIDGVETGTVRFHPAKTFEKNLFDHQSFLTKQIIIAILVGALVIEHVSTLRIR